MLNFTDVLTVLWNRIWIRIQHKIKYKSKNSKKNQKGGANFHGNNAVS
jgi:hypothetical protein